MEIVADKIIEKEQLAEQRGLARGIERGIKQELERSRIEREHLIDKYIKKHGEDYRFEVDPSVEKTLRNRKIDNTDLARKKGE